MDHWVCGMVHAFNQIWTGEWPVGPGRSGWSVWYHMSHHYWNSSPHAAPGGAVLPDMGHSALLYIILPQCLRSTLHRVLLHLLRHISILDHSLWVTRGHQEARAGWLRWSPREGLARLTPEERGPSTLFRSVWVLPAQLRVNGNSEYFLLYLIFSLKMTLIQPCCQKQLFFPLPCIEYPNFDTMYCLMSNSPALLFCTYFWSMMILASMTVPHESEWC